MLLSKNIKLQPITHRMLDALPFDWTIQSIEGLNINLVDGDRGTNYPSKKDMTKSGYCVFLDAKNISKDGFSLNELTFISKEKHESLNNGKLNLNDIVLTSRGTLGNVGYYSQSIYQEAPVCRINSGMVILRASTSTTIDPKFLNEFVCSRYFQNQLINDGGVVPQLTISKLKKYEIFTPPIEEQKLISAILDKSRRIIQNNVALKQNHELAIQSLRQKLLTGKTRVALSKAKIAELTEKKILTIHTEDIENETISYPVINEDMFDDFANNINLDSDIVFSPCKTSRKNCELNELIANTPIDWDVSQLVKMVVFVKGLSIPEPQLNYSGTGLKYLKTTEFWLDSSSKRDTVHYTGKVDPKHIKQKDEYVFSLDGFNSKIREGTLGLVSNEDEGIVSTSFYKLKKNDIYHLVVNVLKSNYVQNFIMRLGEGTTVFHAGKYINNLQGIFPKSTVEQKLLSMIFEKEEKLIDALKEKIKLEEKVFKYLQQELLSGRIRVTTEA